MLLCSKLASEWSLQLKHSFLLNVGKMVAVPLKIMTLCNNYNICVIFAKKKPTFTPFTYVKSSGFVLIFILSYAQKGLK